MRTFNILVLLILCLVANVGCAAQNRSVRGTNLREIIEEQIRDNIRESHGELAGQNFSWDDYERFTRDKVPEQVTTLLRTSPEFLRAVDKVRSMPEEERKAYLKRCRLPLRKTWAELGEITPRGTTEAGRKGEAALSNAIVDLAEKLLVESPKAAPAETKKGGA